MARLARLGVRADALRVGWLGHVATRLPGTAEGERTDVKHCSHYSGAPLEGNEK